MSVHKSYIKQQVCLKIKCLSKFKICKLDKKKSSSNFLFSIAAWFLENSILCFAHKDISKFVYLTFDINFSFLLLNNKLNTFCHKSVKKSASIKNFNASLFFSYPI